MEIKITGLLQIEENFRRLADRKTLDRNVSRSARVAMKPVLEEAKRLVPVDEGDLRDSLILSVRKTRAGNRSARVGPDTKSVVRADKSGGLDFGKKKRPANYAHLVEKGTTAAAAKPFLRPAFDGNSDNAVKTFRDEMKKGLDWVIKKAGISG